MSDKIIEQYEKRIKILHQSRGAIYELVKEHRQEIEELKRTVKALTEKNTALERAMEGFTDGL